MKYKLNRRMPNGMYGGVRGEKFTKNYLLLDFLGKKSHNLVTIRARLGTAKQVLTGKVFQ